MIHITVLDGKQLHQREEANFIEGSINGTFYHNTQFLEFYADKVKKTVALHFMKKDKIVALLPGGIAEDNGSLVFLSPFSASFSGLCYSEDLKTNEAIEIIKILEGYLKERKISKVVIQNPPIIYFNNVDERFDYALNLCGFTEENAGLTFYLETLANVSSSVARNIKKAERHGLIFRETDDFSSVWDFLYQSKIGKGFYLSVSLADLLSLNSMLQGKIKLFGVYSEDTLLSALVLYCLNRRVALGFTWAQDDRYQEMRPTDYLIYNTARVVFSEGYKYFDLGTGTLNGEPVWGVIRFKENYRPYTAMRKRYSKDLF